MSLDVRPKSGRMGRAKPWRVGLFPRLLICFLILSLPPLVILGARASFRGRESIQQLVFQQLEIEALRIAAQVQNFLQDCERDLAILSRRPLTENLALGVYNSRNGEIWYRSGEGADWVEARRQLPLYKELAHIDLDGHELLRVEGGRLVPPEDLRDVSDPANTTFGNETYFADTLALPPGEIYVSRVTARYVNQFQQLKGDASIEDTVPSVPYEAVIRFASRVLDEEGNISGVTVLTVDHRHLMEFVEHVIPLSSEQTVFPKYASGNYAYMFDDQGWFIAHPKLWNLRGLDASGELVPAYVRGQTPAEMVEGGTIPLNLNRMSWNAPWYDRIMPTVRGGESFMEQAPNVGYRDVRPTLRVRVWVPIPYDKGVYKESGIIGGIHCGAEVGVVEQLSGVMRQDMILVALAVGLLVVVMAVWLSRGIARPILDLRDAAGRVAAGDLAPRIHTSRADEVGDLAHAFNDMVTRLRESQRRLREAERFASIGEVISGTAHAIKTELNIYGLVNNVSLLERKTPPDAPERKYVEALKRGIEDLESIVTALLVPAPDANEPHDVNQVVTDALASYQRRGRAQGVEVDFTPDHQSPPVRLDRQLLARALMNLFDNAMDAMPNGGRLVVTIHGGPDGVSIDISDSGTGVSDEVRERMFYPFFTTKRDSGGSGMGLYQSLRILADHDGTLDVVEPAHGGTTFRVTLPRAK